MRNTAVAFLLLGLIAALSAQPYRGPRGDDGRSHHDGPSWDGDDLWLDDWADHEPSHDNRQDYRGPNYGGPSAGAAGPNYGGPSAGAVGASWGGPSAGAAGPSWGEPSAGAAGASWGGPSAGAAEPAAESTGSHYSNIISETPKKYPEAAREVLCCADYAYVWRLFDGFIESNPDAIPAMVRLAFHDCVGKACDGCINRDDFLNDGLGEFIDPLNALYETLALNRILSLADFYSLGGHVALVHGYFARKCSQYEGCPMMDMKYWYGRKDCPTSPTTTGTDGFPNAHGGFAEVMRVLQGNFKLDNRGVVALSGCHSLGGADPNSSGFNWNWQFNSHTFDNGYYKNLVNLKFTHSNEAINTTPRWEFTARPNPHQDPVMMLNTDMAIYKKLDPVVGANGRFTGSVSCTMHGQPIPVQDGAVDFVVHNCDDAPTANFVREYAHSLKSFYRDFPHAWFGMVSNGYTNAHGTSLKLPGLAHESCINCVPYGGYCVPGFGGTGACCKGHTCMSNKCL